MKGSSIAVLYHYPCTDGAFAAYIAHLALGDTAVLIPHATHTTVHLEDGYDTVYLLDYVGTEGFLAECVERFPRVVLLDHHESALQEVCEGADVVLDVTKSGCMLAKEHFFKDGKGVNPRLETFLEYVQDNDLFRHELPHSKMFTAGLRRLNPDFTPDYIKTQLPSILDWKNIVSLGHTQLIQEELWMAEANVSAFPIKLGDQVYWAAITDHWEIISELGHLLAERNGYGAVVRQLTNGLISLSLRSTSKDYNTIPHARLYGGGGHPSASGCRLESWEEFDKLRE